MVNLVVYEVYSRGDCTIVDLSHLTNIASTLGCIAATKQRRGRKKQLDRNLREIPRNGVMYLADSWTGLMDWRTGLSIFAESTCSFKR